MEEKKPLQTLFEKLRNRKVVKAEEEINLLKLEIEKAKLRKELERINNEPVGESKRWPV
jgi:FtsZ-binding cell division protein ZapB